LLEALVWPFVARIRSTVFKKADNMGHVQQGLHP
jgi:hypothetical protein